MQLERLAQVTVQLRMQCQQVTQVNKKTQPVKPGRPMTTHRKKDEELFKHLRNNPEGIGIERKEWQIPKWNKFKSG